MEKSLRQHILEGVESHPKGWGAWIRSKDNRYIIDALNNEYKDFPKLTIPEQIYWLKYNLKDYPKCKTCGKPTKLINGTRGYHEFCCCTCAQLDDEVRSKLANTNLLRYGVDNCMKNEDIRLKVKQTCMERYGVDNAFKSEFHKNKIKETCIRKFGFDNCMKNKDIQLKAKQTCMDRYGVDCGYKLNPAKNISKGEIEVYEYIKSICNFTCIHSDRDIITPLELDIYIPEKQLGIEYDGDYWHSLPNMKRRDYLKNKICKMHKIKLFRISEHDWHHDKDNIKKKISNIIYG